MKPKAVFSVFIVGAFLLWFFFLMIEDYEASYNSNAGSAPDSSEATYDPGYYRVPFGADFSRGLAAVDELGLSILIAVDCSGSMSRKPESGGDAKYLQATRSLDEIVRFLEEFMASRGKDEASVIKVGIVKFSTSVREVFPVTEMTQQGFAKLRSITSDPANFKPGGDTAIGKTLERGAEMLAQSGTIFKSLIVISDGENTEGINPETVLEAIVLNRNTASDPDYTVYTNNILVSFIGFDVDSGLFSGLGTVGARVTNAQSAAALKESLKDIFLADITKLEAK